MVYMQFILKFRCILKTFGVFFIEFILKFYFRINFEFQKYIYYGMEIVYYYTHIYQQAWLSASAQSQASSHHNNPRVRTSLSAFQR